MGIFSELGRRVGKFEKRARSAKEEAVGEGDRRCADCGAEFDGENSCPDCGSTAVQTIGDKAGE